jgi:UDP-glucose:(heptosyl)LPS alpha-1,3-glucosyltransferase
MPDSHLPFCVHVRIALVILHADPSRGGAERYTIDLASALANRGHQVALLAASFADRIANVSSIRLTHWGLSRASRYGRFLDSLDCHLAQTHYDVIHAMLPVRHCDLYHPHAGIAAETLDRWTVHFNPRRRAMAEVERQILSSPKPPIVLALSDYVKEFIQRHYPTLPLQSVAKLFNAVHLEHFQPAHQPHNLTTGLIIANDFERKGLAQALRALAQIGPTRLNLDVVGKEDPGRYDAMAKDLGVADAVVFWGAANDPRPRYAAADFLVLPTRHDPCSLVVLEALAMGLPVITTRFNGAAEAMTDGVHGFVLNDPEDVDALAGAMRKMLDPAARQRMSEACLALRPMLSYEHHLKELLKIYARVTSGKRVPAGAAV